MGSVSYTTSSVKYRTGYHPLLPSVFVTPFPASVPGRPDRGGGDDRALHELRAMLRHVVAPEDIACFLIEPVQGEGGYYPAPAAFLQELRDLADRHGILLIADEIQTGFGRTGTWWGIDNYDIAPDIITIGKAIANGLPLSAVGSSHDLFGKWPPGVHGTTFGGNAVACAAAVEVVNVVNDVLPGVPASRTRRSRACDGAGRSSHRGRRSRARTHDRHRTDRRRRSTRFELPSNSCASTCSRPASSSIRAVRTTTSSASYRRS